MDSSLPRSRGNSRTVRVSVVEYMHVDTGLANTHHRRSP
jgi:hypothetical protein